MLVSPLHDYKRAVLTCFVFTKSCNIMCNMFLKQSCDNCWFRVVPFKEVPSYNSRRRKSVLSMRHSASSSRLQGFSGLDCLSGDTSPSPSLVHNTLVPAGAVRILPPLPAHPPPSPSPSERWLQLGPLLTSTASVRSDTGSSSSCTAESEDNASANGSSLTGKLLVRCSHLTQFFIYFSCIADKLSVDQCDVVSDSSGVGTSNSGSGGSYDATPSEHSLVLPGMTVVCIEPYSSKEPNHLQLQPGDIIEGNQLLVDRFCFSLSSFFF